jgi:hypothetical protein
MRIIYRTKEVAMTELDKGQKAGRRPKKYLWFGYGNYGTQPNLQIPAGNVRDSGIFEELSKEPKTERSPMAFFGCAAIVVVGLMGIVMLLAWVVSLVVR